MQLGCIGVCLSQGFKSSFNCVDFFDGDFAWPDLVDPLKYRPPFSFLERIPTFIPLGFFY